VPGPGDSSESWGLGKPVAGACMTLRVCPQAGPTSEAAAGPRSLRIRYSDPVRFADRA
jgi:hypothetical protein